MIDRAAILAQYRAGIAIKIIAADHGVRDSYVSHIAVMAGLRRRARISRSAPAEKIAAAYVADVPIHLIAKRYRTSRQRIYQIAAEMDLPRRKRGRRAA